MGKHNRPKGKKKVGGKKQCKKPPKKRSSPKRKPYRFAVPTPKEGVREIVIQLWHGDELLDQEPLDLSSFLMLSLQLSSIFYRLAGEHVPVILQDAVVSQGIAVFQTTLDAYEKQRFPDEKTRPALPQMKLPVITPKGSCVVEYDGTDREPTCHMSDGTFTLEELKALKKKKRN